jgi:hypothetical protein
MPQGGYRPTAPQNNTGVSSVGGAGSKDGQPNRYISGGKYGEGKAMMQQQQGASMAKSAMPAVTANGEPTPRGERVLPPLQSLTDNIGGKYSDVTDGGAFGSPIGPDAMPKNISANTRPDENRAIVTRYLPDLVQAASYKGAPDSFKRFVNYLASN